jgi:threonyl-tRNA synthetase
MLHRAILGSFERFIGILIEQYSGRFPVWLSPQQLSILTVTSDGDDAALELAELLKPHNIRFETDIRNEKINYKIREHMTNAVPILAIIGKTEAADKTVSVRQRGSDEKITMSFTDFVDFVNKLSTPPDLL